MATVSPMTRVNTRSWINDPVLTLLHGSDFHYAPAGTQNRDEAPVGSGATDPNERLVIAMNAMPSKVHPIGGLVDEPDAVLVTGDNVHEGVESTARFAADFSLGRSGNVPWPAYTLDGNHDTNEVRNLILYRHSSLNWGVKLKHVWFQAMTENYTAPLDTTPPTAAQVAAVASSISGRPANEPTIFLLHRSMTGGYAAEWGRTSNTTLTAGMDNVQISVTVASSAGLSIGQRIHIDNEEMEITNIVGSTITITRGVSLTVKATHSNGATVYETTALDAFEAMCNAHNTLCVLNGHDHATRHNTWRGVRVFSPGSVTQGAPMDEGPYASIYPEAFNVIRIGHGWMDIANYNFGYDGTQVNPRNWSPDTWNWAESFRFPA